MTIVKSPSATTPAKQVLERQTFEVHLEAAELGFQEKVGVIHRNLLKEEMPASFQYEESFEKNPARFMLDPRLDIHTGEQYPIAGAPGFGIFLDSAPDRWGRMLMERREAAEAHKEKRQMRTLREVDFMLGVHDITRMGALRFRKGVEEDFLDARETAAPPVTSLSELAEVSRRLEEPGAEELPEYEKWLSMLIAPGSSLGGARPKANFTDKSGALWFAKFPSKEDRYDVGGWEFLVHQMAHDAGIWVPLSRVEKYVGDYRTFCVERFDRLGDSRRMFVSAMTLLERQDGEGGGSYIDLVELLSDQGAQGHIDSDLEQLYRRVLFNVMVGNRDDHLRNHGFLRDATGWRLAPAFDMNPNVYKSEHAITLDGKIASPNLQAVRDTAEDYYRLTQAQAAAIEQEVTQVVQTWRTRAEGLQLPRFEIQQMERVFLG
jgi:serine/threonine-protein kinase HipA